jgi:DUF1680 family protein
MTMFKKAAWGSVLFLFVLAYPASMEAAMAPTTIKTVAVPPLEGASRFYVSNRPPLRPGPLVKLPIGAIEPEGWLSGQLQLMRDGFTGRLEEISRFLKSDSGWIDPGGKGWEEMPYWLKGFGDLGYVLKDAEMIGRARRWIEVAIRSQQPDGYFGPPANKDNYDLWPNMVMLFALQSFHEATGDERVLSVMTKYFRYLFDLSVDKLLPGSWQKLRGGDNLESVYWLYNRTGEAWLLDLGKRLFERTSDWTSPILTAERDTNWVESEFYHGVNIAMGIRQPGIYFQQSHDPKLIDAVERNYRSVMDAYGRQPGGMFGADENIRPGHGDPRQGAETCTMVELMYSDESLARITGEGRYLDRVEEIAFNSLPAALTPDLKGLHYLTAPNLVSCDAGGEHDFQNGGTLVSYDPWSYRCCQHNVAFGWPYYAEHLWMATLDDGLAAALYAPCRVRAKAGDGTEVAIAEETNYPFGGTVEFKVGTPKPVAFPLYLRIPEWAGGAKILLNGRDMAADARAGGYVVLNRTWENGDRVRIDFPQRIEVKVWETLGNAVSVRRGPLWYSLRIGEEWKRYGGTDEWPAREILPTTPWNYGLVVDPARPEESIRVVKADGPARQPFAPEDAPVVLEAKARRIPGWAAEGNMVGKLPSGPIFSAEPVEKVSLIPMGCARLRISVFPRIRGS